MAVQQAAYAAVIPVGFPGMVYNGETSNRISRTIEDAAGIGFGKAAFWGAGDHGCTGTPTAGKLYGIAIVNEGGITTALSSQADTGYAQYASVGIMTKGVINVLAGVAVNRGDQAYVTSAGLITNASSGNVILPNWFFDKTITAAGVVPLANRA